MDADHICAFLFSMGEPEMAEEVSGMHQRLEAFSSGLDKDCRQVLLDRIGTLEQALRPFSDAFAATGIQSYRGTNSAFADFLDRNQVTPAEGINMGSFRHAYEALTGKPACEHDTNKQNMEA